MELIFLADIKKLLELQLYGNVFILTVDILKNNETKTQNTFKTLSNQRRQNTHFQQS